MPILNYTTSIDVHKTTGEIMRSLAKFGAHQIGLDYEGGEPSAISFMLDCGQAGVLLFRLPSNYRGVLNALENSTARNVTAKHRTPEQARRVAWRIVKDWIEAQLAIVEAEVARPEQVLLPYAVTDNNKTVYELFSERPQHLLGSGSN